MKEEYKFTGKPLCLFVRNIETTSATFMIRGKETTFKGQKPMQTTNSRYFSIEMENQKPETMQACLAHIFL